MNSQTLFLIEVKNILGENVSPASLVTQWREFVKWCEDGYQWDISEYNNEISVRDKLEQLLMSQKLQSFNELQQLKITVEEIDQDFKKLLKDDVKLINQNTWWKQGILKKAGGPYATYFQNAYDIEVEIF